MGDCASFDVNFVITDGIFIEITVVPCPLSYEVMTQTALDAQENQQIYGIVLNHTKPLASLANGPIIQISPPIRMILTTQRATKLGEVRKGRSVQRRGVGSAKKQQHLRISQFRLLGRPLQQMAHLPSPRRTASESPVE